MNFKLEIDDIEFKKLLSEMRGLFPEISARALGFIGIKGKQELKVKYLSGQYLNLKAFPRDKTGKRTVSYTVGKNAKFVKISSFPVNLFERGRLLRSGKKEPGKYIITRKFKQAMMGNVQKYLNQFDNNILEKELKKL